MPDVVCFGEAMVRLAPPHFQRIEQARSFDIEVGGAELNAGVGLARLGHRVEWVSALPADPLGRLVANRVREAGVGDRFVKFDPDARCGLYFLEFGAAPRASNLVYDRANSAASRVVPGQFDWPAIFAGVNWFHVTGITPALSATAAAVTAEALAAAHAAGVRTSIDLNYRSKLWSREDAARTMAELIRGVSLLIASAADAEFLFGVTGGSFAEVASKLADKFGVKAVAGMQRETPLVWRNRVSVIGWMAGTVIESPWYEVEIVDRLGAGDAAASGLIHGLLAGDFEQGVQTAAAMAALKHSVPGDLPWLDKDEIAAVLAGHGLRIRR